MDRWNVERFEACSQLNRKSSRRWSGAWGDVVSFLRPCGPGCLWEICPISQNVNNSDSNGSSWLSPRLCAGELLGGFCLITTFLMHVPLRSEPAERGEVAVGATASMATGGWRRCFGAMA